ncbi:hypothetical protein GUITHDRAFT_112474 [Guillardia theta CCMP2712]|uniref:Uncharacterized protein n=1 Tax=Guillardia theta (strain CCMP2712) TaxID=905079 RepID=L1IZ31_GUITC|nr:hypothetical protein GUITHDRAFT_112474 [Guillardia theta CCMP2712]EKX41501.1 hypothetical protein GUITHDRAFT_112474 [Guillardia theta CCMP2712]|eukprot:XP_005828481.1 hypothetical protein GUITHDRAFT_112474 [Guillardia theta CCMP2712]
MFFRYFTRRSLPPSSSCLITPAVNMGPLVIATPLAFHPSWHLARSPAVCLCLDVSPTLDPSLTSLTRTSYSSDSKDQNLEYLIVLVRFQLVKFRQLVGRVLPVPLDVFQLTHQKELPPDLTKLWQARKCFILAKLRVLEQALFSVPCTAPHAHCVNPPSSGLQGLCSLTPSLCRMHMEAVALEDVVADFEDVHSLIQALLPAVLVGEVNHA